MSWIKQKPVEQAATCCLNCGPKPIRAEMSQWIAVGFGSADLLRDGEVVVDGENSAEPFTFEDAERLAAADPDHDWQVDLNGPMSSAVYQRHGEREWMLIKTGMGFA